MKLIYHNNEMSHWYDLVLLAQKDAEIQLEDELEGYVVMMLMRFNRSHLLADAVLALEFLDALDCKNNHTRHDQMREVADKCLIYSGLFPERTKKKQVSDHYFVQIGQSAYRFLHEALGLGMPLLSKVYKKLSSEFVTIVDVISAMRIKTPCVVSKNIMDEEQKMKAMADNYQSQFDWLKKYN